MLADLPQCGCSINGNAKNRTERACARRGGYKQDSELVWSHAAPKSVRISLGVGTEDAQSSLVTTTSKRGENLNNMAEFWDAATTPVAIIFFIPLGVSLVLWLVSMIGILDIGGDIGDSFGEDAVASLGLGGVPPLVVFSIVSLIAWFLAVVAAMFLLDPLGGLTLLAGRIGGRVRRGPCRCIVLRFKAGPTSRAPNGNCNRP